MRMSRLLVAVVTVGLVASHLPGCAAPLRVLSGDIERKRLAVHVVATVSGDGARVGLSLDNRGEEPVGVDLDALVVRDGGGREHKVLGKQQRFRRDGETSVQRVPHGAVTIEPHAREEIALEFDAVSGKGPLVLAMPALYRLSIEGQVPLKAVEVPLALDAKATAAAAAAPPDAGFYDPFVEE